MAATKATLYGEQMDYRIWKDLDENGIHIISGLAIGIDTCAHIGAIQTKSIMQNIIQQKLSKIGRTIAVLGSGINNIYPKENIQLARQIIKSGGCIISEYPLNSKPEKLHFPQRNRIISALSDGVLVVEASKTSGALITVEFALEQGKDVFAIPGDITKEQSKGCNELIKDGAILITSSQEILDIIN